MHLFKRNATLAAAISAIILTACGGGGDDAVAVNTASNPFTAMVGTWSSGCLTHTQSYGPNFTVTTSEQLTAVLSAPTGADTATVSIHDQTYRDSATCAAANLDQEGTLGGQITALAGTKTIVGDPAHPKTGVAKTATFRYDSISLHNVTMRLPNIGYTSSVGYMLEGGKLYGVSGTQASDGLGSRFANIALTKQ